MTLANRFAKLDAREQRLLTVLGAVFAALVLLGIPLGVATVISGRQDENEKLLEVIQTVRTSRAQVAERQARRAAVLARYAKPAPPLAGFLEQAARQNGVEVPESQDRPEVAHGKKYTERVSVVRLRRIGLRPLAKTLESIKRSGFPVTISRLNIKTRSGEADSYDVELGVSAFDRKADAPSATTGSDAPKDKP